MKKLLCYTSLLFCVSTQAAGPLSPAIAGAFASPPAQLQSLSTLEMHQLDGQLGRVSYHLGADHRLLSHKAPRYTASELKFLRSLHRSRCCLTRDRAWLMNYLSMHKGIDAKPRLR